MKKLLVFIAFNILLANGAQANQEESINPENVNIEKLTIKSNMPLNLNKNNQLQIDSSSNIKDIIINKIELLDDNYGNGCISIEVEILTNQGGRIIKHYKKEIKAGYDYYSEIIAGPLKTLQVEGKLKQ